MKFYVASKWDKRTLTKGVISIIESKGHEVAHDWTEHQDVRPFGENLKLANEYACADMDAIKSSDFFLIIDDGSEASQGANTELGAAIALHREFGRPKIYVLANGSMNNIFYYMPFVKAVKNTDEIFEDLEKI